MFLKHIGKHSNRKVAILYRTVPGEEHMCLVCYTETIPSTFHDAIMRVIESDVGQQANELSDALFRNLLPDGRSILEALHAEGYIKKIQSSQVIVTPNAKSHVRLDELNKIIDDVQAGNEASKKLADIDKNAGFVDPSAKKKAAVSAVTDKALDDSSIADTLMQQSIRMEAEANAMLSESKRLRDEAYSLEPSLKPKRGRKKVAA